ncbi:NAD(P)-binding protein [Wolfiporia cocos MD-104 SS10]|uniref:NAD(P)-binding protein n=1 Tax=Wolfiporia cocos (strain MD-104) TaxID=742152 RepID=A0A2H3K278_WOLCO|nr:NAD(P)-binding protein [Wolfiporia cocos MD-104 SS10]
MPVAASGKILVTGANGYIGAWVVRTFLEQGYSVRAALEFAIVADITQEGAFDEAAKGIDAIQHIASPVIPDGNDPQELIGPAVNGTLGILESARVHGDTMKRVVVTSSCGAVIEYSDKPRRFSEADWNEQAVTEVQEKGKAADSLFKYYASKVLAERAAWEYVEKHRDELRWGLVVINPHYTYGPVIHDVNSPDELTVTMDSWYRCVLKDINGPQLYRTADGSEWADVRDVAHAHVLAVQKPEAAGNRIIVSQGPWKWEDWIIAARHCGAATCPVDESYDSANAVRMVTYDTSRAARLLGMKYRSIQECTSDIVADFRARRWM